MNFLRRVKIKDFNRRSLTEDDALEFCKQENITVIEADVPTSFYFVCKGRAFIVLKKSLKKLKKLFDLWHEISHHLHNSSSQYEAYFFGLIESKNEIEADAFATVAIVPLTALDNYEFLDNHPRSRFARNLFKERQRLAFLYQI